MIRPLVPEDIDSLLPLLIEFYIEQSTYTDSMDIDYIKSNILLMLNRTDYLMLTDDTYSCLLIGHIGTNVFFPITELIEDCIYVVKDKRGSSLFCRLVLLWELFGAQNGIKYVNIGISTGITVARTEQLYRKLGYKQCGSAFKKELSMTKVEYHGEVYPLMVGA